AFCLRFSDWSVIPSPWWLWPACALITPLVLYICGFYRSIVRYLGSEVAWSIVWGVGASVVILAAMVYMANATLPRSILVIFGMLAVLHLGASRFLARRILFHLVSGYLNREPVVVFGAGVAGAQLVSALLAGRELRPVLVVDDDHSKHGTL